MIFELIFGHVTNSWSLTFLQVGHVAKDREDEHAGDEGGPGVDGARDEGVPERGGMLQ